MARVHQARAIVNPPTELATLFANFATCTGTYAPFARSELNHSAIQAGDKDND
jgi:hypothetical protein